MISIIIPVFDEEKSILDVIQQFKSITVPHEIIIADGGSTDGTVTLAKQYADIVTIYPKGIPQTIASNRNHGAAVAQGDFLVFLDATSRVQNVNSFFERALAHFSSNKKLVALTCGIYVDPSVATLMDRIVFSVMTFNLIVLNNLLHLGIAQGKFQMIRRKAFEQLGGFREDLAATEDQDMFARLSKIGRTMIDPSITVYHDGRRAHALGWLKLLFIWWRDGFSYLFRGKIVSKKWQQAPKPPESR